MHERIKLLIAIRDRQLGGVVSLLASMAESAILDRRTSREK